MRAATIAALRAMRRDEIKNGVLEMEHSFTNELDRPLGDIKGQLEVETTTRQELEERIPHLKRNSLKQNNSTMDAGSEEKVDKAVVVAGGYVDKAIEVLGMLLFNYDHATAIPTMVGDSKQRSGICFLETMMICLVLVDLVPEMIEIGCFGGRCWNMVCLSKLDGNIRHDDLDLPTFHGWSAGPDGLCIF